jgi:hypothetical protein
MDSLKSRAEQLHSDSRRLVVEIENNVRTLRATIEVCKRTRDNWFHAFVPGVRGDLPPHPEGVHLV